MTGRTNLAGGLAVSTVLLLGAMAAASAQDTPAAPVDPGKPEAGTTTSAPAAPPAAAADAVWPCVQRRVGRISAGVVWSGPDPAQAGPWDKDFDAAALAQKLASRRTALEDVDTLIDAFVSKTSPDDKDPRLTRVFAGMLDLVNAERDRVVQGIGRYARGQSKLAERVRLEADKLGDATDAPNPPQTKEIEDLETALKWDKRIFEERSRSLTYVCETPVLLERRAFDIARRIQQRL